MSAVLDGWARLVTGRRSAWAVIAGWVLLLVVATPLALGLGDTQSTDPVNYLPTGAQSTALLQELAGIPGGNVSPAVVIYARPGGLIPADRARIGADRAAVPAQVTHAGRSGPVRVSADGAAALFTVDLPSQDAVLNVAVPQLRQLTATATRNSLDRPDADTLRVAVTGPAGYTADANQAAAGIDGTLLIAAASVVIVLLLLIYRSPLLWLLPILTVTGGLLTAQAAITLLARHGVLTVTDLAAGILNVLVFGAATDYALLLIARCREQLHTTTDHHHALAAAVRSATPAIAASAGSVIAGMLCLLAATITANRGLGPVAALGITGGLLASLTLLPALLAVTGRRVFWPRTPQPTHAADPTPTPGTIESPVASPAPPRGVWAQLATVLGRHPRRIWVLTALLLAFGVLGLVDTRLGLPQAGTFRGTVQSVTGQQLLDTHFPPGASSPTQILADTTQGAAVRRAVATTPGIVKVTEASATPATPGRTMLQATLTAPPDSPAAMHTITVLRDRLATVPAAHALVGGATAVQLDIARGAAHDRAVVMPLVLAVVLLVLILLLGALVAPLVLLATVVLSYAAALGVSVALFDALGLAGTDPSVPLYVFLFLVALGVDYNIFLMTRVREETVRAGTRAGTLRGLALTGGVITSAGLVLAATFATLAVLPLVVLTETGIAVALGVLLDTFLVRSLLVPALTYDLGDRVWWPRRSPTTPPPSPPRSGADDTGPPPPPRPRHPPGPAETAYRRGSPPPARTGDEPWHTPCSSPRTPQPGWPPSQPGASPSPTDGPTSRCTSGPSSPWSCSSPPPSPSTGLGWTSPPEACSWRSPYSADT